MKRLIVVAAVLLTGSTTVAQEPAVAPNPGVESETVSLSLAPEAQVSHLDLWLRETSEGGRRNRLMSGSLAIVGSALLVTFGTLAMLDDSPRTEFSKGFGFVAATAGGATLVMGVTLLAIPSPAERRYERWQRTKQSGVTDSELGRFEGELRYSLTVRADSKLRQRRWGSLGLVVGGGLLIGLTAASNLSDLARRLGYGVGGTLVGVGVIGFGLSFTRPTDLWQRYEAGRAPRGAQAVKTTMRVAPMVSRRMGGIAVGGRF